MLGHCNSNGGIFFQEGKVPVNDYQFCGAIVISQENSTNIRSAQRFNEKPKLKSMHFLKTK